MRQAFTLFATIAEACDNDDDLRRGAHHRRLAPTGSDSDASARASGSAWSLQKAGGMLVNSAIVRLELRSVSILLMY